MSWSRPLFVILGVLALAGCGFHSLYGKEAVGEKVAAELARVEIEPIRDRVGQQLRNALLDALTPNGTPARPAYELSVGWKASERDLAVKSTALSTRANLTLNVEYRLGTRTGAETKTIFSGQQQAVAGYNIFTSDFATLEARKDAEARAVRQVAHGIHTQLAVFFAQRAEENAARR